MCCPLKQAIKDKTSFGLLTFSISMDWRNLMEKPIAYIKCDYGNW